MISVLISSHPKKKKKKRGGGIRRAGTFGMRDKHRSAFSSLSNAISGKLVLRFNFLYLRGSGKCLGLDLVRVDYE